VLRNGVIAIYGILAAEVSESVDSRPPPLEPVALRRRGAVSVTDVIVIGGGGVGLATALAAARRGLAVTLVAEHRAGEAFPAAAGILAPPALEMAERGVVGAEHAFAVAARDRYPSYVSELADLSGIEVPLNRLGLLHVVLDGADSPETAGSTWLDRAALAALEPALGRMAGARLFHDDGAVDNVVLYRALEVACARSARVKNASARARGIEIHRHGVSCRLGDGTVLTAGQLVLAAGAWSALIDGLPRPLPVEPLRGQMISLGASPLRHVAYGEDGYLVPRGDLTLVGATMEWAAFDVSTTTQGVAGLRAVAAALCPSLAAAPLVAAWAGLRPVSPDFLPIICRDPDHPSLIYACGHSRNGVLMAPLTGDCIAALLGGEAPPADISPFTIERFELTVEAANIG
jgi:glycine oxidase